MSGDGEIDLENRDPNSLNSHLTAAFEEVLGEPDSLHSVDCVWRNSYKCYNCGKNCCYKFLSILCGIFAALCWGCCFASTAATHVWCFTPFFKIYDLNCACFRRFYKTIIDCLVGPLCEVCGLCFAQIKVTNA